MLLRASVCLATVLAFSQDVSSANSATIDSTDEETSYLVADTTDDSYVSLTQTRLISTGATVGSFLLAGIPAAGPLLTLGAIAVVPSYGSYRVGDHERFGRGVLTRSSIIGAGGLLFTGTLLYCWDRSCSYQEQAGAIALLSIALHAVYDIFVLSSRAVQEHNERIKSGYNNISLRPWMHPDTGSAGMSVYVRF